MIINYQIITGFLAMLEISNVIVKEKRQKLPVGNSKKSTKSKIINKLLDILKICCIVTE